MMHAKASPRANHQPPKAKETTQQLLLKNDTLETKPKQATTIQASDREKQANDVTM
jgi:hypothetical protein